MCILRWTCACPVFAFLMNTVTCLSSSENVVISMIENKYEPTWESLDSRPLPDWYENAKVGIFVHWGVFSVPSFGSEWFWKNWKDNSTAYVEFMKKNYAPDFTYQDFASEFTAELFDPDEWAQIFENSGARYVVLTSKHHEGYTLWPSAFSFSWNAMDVGPRRDLLGDLMNSIRYRTGLKFGLYHSLFEWYNPLYLQDKASGFISQIFARDKTMPELYELVNTYQPEVIWSDGDWEAPDTYWNSTEFIAWLYNESPVRDTVVVNDRWGINIPCKHGDFFTCSDRYNPGVLVEHKWENCMTLDKHSWGYRRNAKLTDYVTSDELIATLAETISCGGNILINVGPTKEGTIAPIFQERLRDLGDWLNVNAEAIYPAVPWVCQNDTKTSGVWYTQSSETDEGNPVFAIVLEWPNNNRLLLGCPKMDKGASISFLGFTGDLKWQMKDGSVEVEFPDRISVQTDWAWVLKLQPVN